jgi:hypothetical protein
MYAVIRSGVLNGVTVTGAGDTPAAVVAITGRVKNVNVMQSALAGEHVSKESDSTSRPIIRRLLSCAPGLFLLSEQ